MVAAATVAADQGDVAPLLLGFHLERGIDRIGGGVGTQQAEGEGLGVLKNGNVAHVFAPEVVACQGERANLSTELLINALRLVA
jgi:hypothetical protein